MSSKSLARRRITAQQAKEVFKTAFQKRPESIERLKESVAVSVGKYQRFLKYLKDSTQLFHTSCFKEEIALKGSNKPTQRIQRGKDFALRLDAYTPPDFKPPRETPLFDPPPSTQAQHPSRQHTISHKVEPPGSPMRQPTPTSITTQFWKKVGKGSQKAHRRWKTDADERVGDNTIGDLTRFNKQHHAKAVNYLVLQLQLNIQDSKRCRARTGIQQ